MFFLFTNDEIKPGSLCEFIRNDPRHATMPNLYPDRIGMRVVVVSVQGEWAWCYDDRPVTYRINRRGQRVVDFDPRGNTTPYQVDELSVLEAVPVSKRSWN
ncbi:MULTISPECIES: hypothetical protein [unclassified Paenibacillus]|uniref:hypothetical protein n=1 Tax=unclassified Paenibacillus TaxID=185978 RepID=UPI000956731B|nr:MULTISPECIES: hypothetical protein [unclassified Paenibacillus]ASS66392.1 hypothetical protein CIC07_09680 [Paenibacillus sp. RUD330]SIQ05788.1 hypothetical protein SAMN05880555_0484 [Paenibacillus sp. RU4X]SIQ25941.1 hypothetical protein SAMN05880570_0483 [Paenibacillus sp. RU4T]